MAKTYSAIKTVSDQIKNATTAASNTAAIVGGNLGDIVDKIQEVDGAKVPTTTKVNGKALSGDITLDATDIGVATDLADKVSLTDDETINGTKTFSVSPIIPTPDADMEAATKKYVDDSTVGISGNETIGGVKTFQSSPIVPAPDADMQAATKKYVDDKKATVDAALLNKADLVGGKIPTSQLPSYVDDVLEYTNLAAFPVNGETGKIYVALDTNSTYRWSGSAYVEISKSLELGETSSTAYRGDRGKTAYDHSQTTGNAHGTTAAQIPNTPAGTIAATNVQAAINELDGDVAQVRADLNALNEIVLADTNIFTGISKTGVGNLGIRLDGNVDVNNKYIKLDLRGKTFKLKVFTNELQPQYQILGMNSDGWSDGTYIGRNYLFGIEYEINLDLSKYGIIIYTVGITSSTVRTAEIRVEGNKYGLIHKVEDNTYRITTLEENQINGSDFIKVVPQLLTEEQKSTARNNIDAADYTMIEKTEEVLHYESLSMLGVYNKSYFSKPYLLGTVLKSFSSSTVDTFYLVKDNNALDTSLLIRSKDLPMPIPNNCIGIASNKSGNIDITFSTLEKINQIEKIRADFDTYVSESIKLNLYGKTIGVFGDSILHMKYGEAGNDKSVADWINYITGANVINFATGGSTLKQRTFPTDSPTSANEAFANLDIINMVKALVSGDYTKQIASKNYALTHPEETDLNGQIDSIDRLIASSIEDFDAVLILAGTNDYRNGGATLQNEPLNDMSYTGEAIKEIVSQIMTYQKNISLYWATPIVRYCDPYNFDEWKDYNVDDLVMYNGKRYKFTSQHLKGAWIGTDVVPITALEMRTDFSWGDNFVNSGGITLKEFAKRLKNIMIGYKIPICDMYNELGWNQYNFSKFLLTSDGTHPYYGIEILAKKLISFIQSNRIF